MRTTATKVKDIIDTELTDSRVNAFITSANKVVDRLLINDYDEVTLTDIETWLTAHFIASTFERQAIKEKAGPVEQTFSDTFGTHLESTAYGQIAASLDTKGKLANLGKRAIVFKAISEN